MHSCMHACKQQQHTCRDGVSDGLVDGGLHGGKVHSRSGLDNGIEAAALSFEVVPRQHTCIEAACVHVEAVDQRKDLCLCVATPTGQGGPLHLHVCALLLRISLPGGCWAKAATCNRPRC